MQKLSRALTLVLSCLLLAAPVTLAQRLRPTFNRAAKGTLKQHFNYKARRGGSGDKTGATGRSNHNQRFVLRTPVIRRNNPPGPRP
jgi:hypothetical protein